ncbi:hypothetical protein C8R45DRAFT_307811 [Mycena sanguinolenta]|nr:hypothetical protein C8R45DRAFT_307811 [Mycena sanguinolenta]
MLVDLLVPFHLAYEDGVERLGAESLLERQKWINRIWEALRRPLAESSASDADESAGESQSGEENEGSAGSIRTILSVDSWASQCSIESFTAFVPPMAEMPDIESESEDRDQNRTSVTRRTASESARTFTPTKDENSRPSNSSILPGSIPDRPNGIVIYEAVISCLREAYGAGIPGSRDGTFGSFSSSRNPREVAQIQATLDGHLLSMASENAVSGIVKSLECRKTLLEVETGVETFSEHKNLTTF